MQQNDIKKVIKSRHEHAISSAMLLFKYFPNQKTEKDRFVFLDIQIVKNV